MNKLYFILLAYLITFSSCGKEDLSKSIIGTWDLSSIVVNCSEPEVTLTFEGSGGCVTDQGLDDFNGCISLVFMENGMVDLLEGDTPSELESDGLASYSVNDDNNIVTVCPDGDDCLTFVFNEDTDELSIEIDEDEDCVIMYNFAQ